MTWSGTAHGTGERLDQISHEDCQALIVPQLSAGNAILPWPCSVMLLAVIYYKM